MALMIYLCSSLSFMDEGDGLTACGVIFYIPCYFIIMTYYLWLIWSKGKATGAKMLLLPLLQRVNLFRTYQDDLKGKIELAKTVLPFLLSVFICPMLTSILYYNVCYNKHSQQEWLMVILLLPPVIMPVAVLSCRQSQCRISGTRCSSTIRFPPHIGQRSHDAHIYAIRQLPGEHP